MPKLEGAPCSQRTCQTSFGKITETVRTYDESKLELEYEVIKGFPGFIDITGNNWQLMAADRATKVGKTRRLAFRPFQQPSPI